MWAQLLAALQSNVLGHGEDFLPRGVRAGHVRVGLGGKPLLNHIQKPVTKGIGGVCRMGEGTTGNNEKSRGGRAPG